MRIESIPRHGLLRLFVVLFIVVLVGALGSCKSSSVTVPTTTTVTSNTETQITKRDSTLTTKKDSSYYKAWLECVNGKVVFKQPETRKKADSKPGESHAKKPESKPGRHLAVPNVSLGDDGSLIVDCKAEAEKYRIEWEEKAVKEYLETHKTDTVLVERELTLWQLIQIWAGRVFLAVILLSIIAFIYKPKLPKVI